MSTDLDAHIESLKGATEPDRRHIAVIMDGNGRWAKKRRLPRLAGHRAGTEPVRKCVRASARIGIEYLTLYTFSLENWSRPKAEVAGLMVFLEEVLRRETLELDRERRALERDRAPRHAAVGDALGTRPRDRQAIQESRAWC